MSKRAERLTVGLIALAAGAAGGIAFGQVGGLIAQESPPPMTGSTLIAVQPQQRALDTREIDDITGGNPMTGGQTLQLEIAGEHGVPDDAAAVQLNVTVVDGSVPSHLTVWDEGDNPGTSSLNWVDATARPNAVTTAIGSDGFIRIHNFQGSVNVIVDVVGYYSDAGLVSDFEVVSQTFDISLTTGPGSVSGRSVDCPQGKLVTGGGASILFDDGIGEVPGLDMKTSIPRSDLSGWMATVISESSTNDDGQLNIYAICASGVIAATP